MIELNKRLSDAMQMYHALMKEAPMYGGYSTKYGPPPPQQQQQYSMMPPQDTVSASFLIGRYILIDTKRVILLVIAHCV